MDSTRRYLSKVVEEREMSNVDKFGCWYKTKDRPVWQEQQQQKEKQGENSKYVYLCKGKEHKHTHTRITRQYSVSKS